MKELVFENGFFVIIIKIFREINDIKIVDILNYLKYKVIVELCYFFLMDVIECGLVIIDFVRLVFGWIYY